MKTIGWVLFSYKLGISIGCFMNHILLLYIIFSDLLIKLEFCLSLFLENFLNFYLEFFKVFLIFSGRGVSHSLLRDSQR